MESAKRLGLPLLLAAAPLCCNANEAPMDCHRAAVHAHVTLQIGIYGPLSIDREYFGFVYLHEGTIGSAVVRGKPCPRSFECGVNTTAAAASIPRGAKVLGEWHTHPKGGSETLSAEDVSGAYANRHIRCYVAFLGLPDGEIFAWDINLGTVHRDGFPRDHRELQGELAEGFVQRRRRVREPDRGRRSHVEAILQPDAELAR